MSRRSAGAGASVSPRDSPAGRVDAAATWEAATRAEAAAAAVRAASSAASGGSNANHGFFSPPPPPPRGAAAAAVETHVKARRVRVRVCVRVASLAHFRRRLSFSFIFLSSCGACARAQDGGGAVRNADWAEVMTKAAAYP
jgi:hypothetical protein